MSSLRVTLVLSACLPLFACSDDGQDVDLSSTADLSGPDLALPGDLTPTLFGQADPDAVSEGNAPLDGSTFNFPSTILKVDGKWVVCDSGNQRVLVYSGALGTSSYVTIGSSAIGAAASGSFRFPTALATDGIKLLVTDAYNDRVLIWNSLPTTDFAPADVVLGQADLSGDLANRGLASPSAASLLYPLGVAVIGTRLAVSDWGNNRVLIWNSIPTSNGAPANVVLGQPDFTSGAANRGGALSALGLFGPGGIASDGTRLLVADGSNNRVLIWNTIPSALDVPADVAIGQPQRSTATPMTSQTGLSQPSQLFTLGTSLYIADSANNRVLYYAAIPTVDGAAASGVIGQADFTSGAANRGGAAGAGTFSQPGGIFSDAGKVYVADAGNHRLLEFLTPPVSSLAVASAVYGQLDFVHVDPERSATNTGAGARGIHDIAVSSQHLLVADRRNSRVLVFDKTKPMASAIAAIGQPDLTLGCNQIAGRAACPAASATSLLEVSSIAVDDSGAAYLADRYNNRVLVYAQVPTTSGAAANFVLGQTAMTGSTANAGPTGATKLHQPIALHVSGNQLFVADLGNNRVLRYALPITQNDPAADLVLGQPDFDTFSPDTSATKMNGPIGLGSDAGRLFVVEYGNNRVLVYNTRPTTNGAAADAVLGQASFTETLQRDAAASFGGILAAKKVAVFDGALHVPDRINGAVYAFPASTLTTGLAASSRLRVLGPVAIALDPDGSAVWIADEWGNRVLRIPRAAYMSLLSPF